MAAHPIERLRRMHQSSAWDGKHFQNRLRAPMLSTSNSSTVSRFLFERNEREPPAPLPSVPVDPSVLGGAAHDALRATWLGHSTTLLEIGGRRVLTDPVWSRRISPVSFAGPKRFQPVPVEIDAIPLPDVVIVSHDHYDHLDRASVTTLASRGARFVVPLGVATHLESWGIAAASITEMDWWESIEPVPGLTIRALPSRHFSGRGLTDRNATLWAAWSIEAGGRKVFFGGDGGMDEEAFREIGARIGPFDLTMLEIGAFDPSWASIHLGPERAVEAHALLRGKTLLPIHWGTFDLGLHKWDAPVEELLIAVQRVPTRIALPKIGESFVPHETLPHTAWWRVLRGAPLAMPLDLPAT